MHLHTIKAENFMRLTTAAIALTPSGITEITGANASGKSSLLNAVFALLAGKEALPDQPVHEGAESATITGDLGEFVVTRRIVRTEDGYSTTLSVTTADGAKYTSPQKLLDGLLSPLCFDPLEFTRMKPAEQLGLLRRFVAQLTGHDFGASDAQNKADYERRTDVQRELSRVRAQLAALPEPPAGEVVDLEDAEAQYEQALRENAQRRETLLLADELSGNAMVERGRADDLVNKAKQLRAEADRLMQQAVEAGKRAESMDKRSTETRERAPVEWHIDTIRQKVQLARSQQEQARKAAERAELSRRAEELEAEARTLTEAMERRKAEQREVVAGASLPVQGLSLGEDCVMYNGLPLSQASSAEQLRVSAALAMADNPKLPIMLVRDGSLLDDSSFAMLGEMAASRGYQVLVETVHSGGRVAVEICDGAVKERA